MSKILFPLQAKYIESFRNEKDPLILEMEEYAKKHNVPILSYDSADFMEQLIKMYTPKRVLEIGTAIAYSSIRIAKNLKKKGILHTIEKSEENAEKAKEFISKSDQGNKIKIMLGDAFNILPQLDKKYDFIFLDADKEDYKRLFDYCLVLLKKGGVIFVDNLLWHGYAAVKKVPANY
ncbi:MAG TPA: O-methyltransferase, partial [Ignavibacteriaceae bacterium]|nr:O-methyltransferase [Ignavibacteriaceae bacterium]